MFDFTDAYASKMSTRCETPLFYFLVFEATSSSCAYVRAQAQRPQEPQVPQGSYIS